MPITADATRTQIGQPGTRPLRPLASTIGYYAAFIGLGLVSASLGPTLPGLAEHTRTHLGEISFLFTTRSLGYLGGSLLAGRIYDRMAGHPVMVWALLTMAATMALAPTLPVLWWLAAVLLLLGVAEGTLDVGGNTLLVWVHGSRVGPFMNGLHFFFGVGAFISPIIVAQAVLATGDITWAYWILALLLLPVALWLARLPSPAARSGPAGPSRGVENPRLVALIALFMILYVGAEVSFGGWIYTYATTLRLADVAAAAYLTSLFWGALTAGRLLAIPVAARLRPRTILLLDLLGCLASVGLILLFPRSSPIIWLGTFGTGFAMASIFPTVISWAERRITLNGNVTSWFFVGASLGAMSFPFLIGQLFDALGPRVTMVTILAVLAVATLVFAGLMVYGGPPREDEDVIQTPGGEIR